MATIILQKPKIPKSDVYEQKKTLVDYKISWVTVGENVESEYEKFYGQKNLINCKISWVRKKKIFTT